jgi:toxin YoeB
MKLKGTHLAKKAKELLELIQENPYADPPPFEALVGDLKGAYSRRINIQHRLVYEVVEDEHVIKVLRLWTHYE